MLLFDKLLNKWREIGGILEILSHSNPVISILTYK